MNTLTLNKDAAASASVIRILLLKPDLDADGLLQLVQAHRRLNRLLDQIVPEPDDLLPQAGPGMFSLVSSRSTPPKGHADLPGSHRYCLGCGFTFDSSRPLEAAQHRTH